MRLVWVLPEFLASRLQEQARLVVFQGPFQQPRFQSRSVQGLPFAEAQMAEHLLQVLAAGGGPLAVGRQGFGRDTKLLTHELHHG